MHPRDQELQNTYIAGFVTGMVFGAMLLLVGVIAGFAYGAL